MGDRLELCARHGVHPNIPRTDKHAVPLYTCKFEGGRLL
jgi:hypothetical protein